ERGARDVPHGGVGRPHAYARRGRPILCHGRVSRVRRPRARCVLALTAVARPDTLRARLSGEGADLPEAVLVVIGEAFLSGAGLLHRGPFARRVTRGPAA